MLYTPLTRAAMKLCFEAHEGQLDKAGVPYANHPLHVAEQMRTEAETCAALLHDVLEDTPLTEADLRAAGMPDEVIDALALLTHDPSVPYLEYVCACRANPVARAVKIADLEHNADLTRLPEVTPRDLARAERYDEALAILR